MADGKPFYQGELAERIVAGSQAVGGLFTKDDLAGYEAVWQDPISIGYRGYQVFAPPPSSNGFQILQTLKLMEGFSGEDVEALKLCVTDRIAYGGDPDCVSAPLKVLLSERYAAGQRQRIDRSKAAILSSVRHRSEVPEAALRPGVPEQIDRGETTHFAVADRDGNVVSVTQTLGAFFGSGVAAGDTGIFLNNGCTWFDTDEGGRNPIAPGRQVPFVLVPTQTMRDGRLYASMGTTGGYGIGHTTPQLLMNLLDSGMDVQQAIDTPRFSCPEGIDLLMEESYPLSVRRSLSGWGHHVKLMNGYPMGLGSAHGIVVDSEQGVLHGGSDPRRDGAALGW